MNIPKIKYVFDRKHNADKNTKGKIDLRITYNRTQKFLSTGLSVYPKEWNKAKEEIVNMSEALELNKILTEYKRKAYKIISEMEESDAIDINAVPALLRSRNVRMTFLDYVMTRAEKKNVGDYTKKSYAAFYNKLYEYGKIVYFSDISEKSIRDFDEWLHAYSWKELDRYGMQVTKMYSQATIGSFHKNMKAFISDAVVDGYVKSNPYSTKRIKVDKGGARTEQYLTLEEIQKIETAEMPTRSLSEARDLFIFACKTGLSYVDLMDFDISKIIEIEGTKLYKGKRHKTLISFSSVITDSAYKILEKYNFRLPKIPNQKYNIKLKLIADAAGVDKEISSHWARRSAAMVWLNDGVPLDVVSRILGHTNMAQTSEYAHILDKTIIKEIKKVVDK